MEKKQNNKRKLKESKTQNKQRKKKKTPQQKENINSYNSSSMFPSHPYLTSVLIFEFILKFSCPRFYNLFSNWQLVCRHWSDEVKKWKVVAMQWKVAICNPEFWKRNFEYSSLLEEKEKEKEKENRNYEEPFNRPEIYSLQTRDQTELVVPQVTKSNRAFLWLTMNWGGRMNFFGYQFPSLRGLEIYFKANSVFYYEPFYLPLPNKP